MYRLTNKFECVLHLKIALIVTPIHMYGLMYSQSSFTILRRIAFSSISWIVFLAIFYQMYSSAYVLNVIFG